MQRYIDTKPLGSGRVIVRNGAFFARPFVGQGVPEEYQEALERHLEEFYIIQNWLQGEYERMAVKTYEPVMPEEIKEIIDRWLSAQGKGEKQEKQDTAARSSKASPKPSKKKASTTSTSRQKES